jgi:hypothetical protein
MTATLLAQLDIPHMTGAELRDLAEAADLRDRRRENCIETLCRGPVVGAFAPGAPPLPPLPREVLVSAMSALSFHGFTVEGLVRSAAAYAAGRLPPEIVDGVVISVLRRRTRGEL